jgi:uncharacterized Zn finger protein
MSWYEYAPYVSVAQRRANAKRELAALEKKTGHKADPVVLDGKKIAVTFWGKAWCDNLEAYGDFANRLPRGRTYVRNGSVCDLSVKPGKVTARVCGSELYDVTVTVKPLAADKWAAVKRACAGQIGSLVELLKGKLSAQVMKVVTDRPGGLFPAPREIEMDCSCPDYATMCKHVAAALYGIGARLDRQPELLFTLRGVDHLELIAEAGNTPVTAAATDKAGGAGGGKRRLAAGDLGDVFGIDLEPAETGAGTAQADGSAVAEPTAAASTPTKPKARAKKATRQKAAAPAERAKSAGPGKLAKPVKASAAKMGRPTVAARGRAGPAPRATKPSKAAGRGRPSARGTVAATAAAKRKAPTPKRPRGSSS